ncbi:MAG: type II toxin-antitoxin system HipA family toxin [Lachnospiraceae bacterium]|nr:type II toxin-antitoxin system HipA family toxin [Lachnospiraceae bacterium]
MKQFEVVASWLSDCPTIGVCDITSARGKEVISFSYSPEWLRTHPDVRIDPDLYPVSGRQYPPEDKSCFGFLSDSAPDRWGRKLMDRRERMEAAVENRPVRRLAESDYILGVHDEGRMGALQFRNPESGMFIAAGDKTSIPPMHRLRELEQASLELEKDNDPTGTKWLRDLIEPGSSLGGARPKANVKGEDGSLWIAKFPSVNDEVNTGAWELVLHTLSKMVGIQVPEAGCMRLSETGDTFFIKRFDRDGIKRIQMASAMTLLGATDRATESYDYIDMAGLLEQSGAEAEKDLRELWSRAVFHICTGNADNHLRNHAFLLAGNGWCLSPSFDVNPAYDRDDMELSIGGVHKRDIRAALDAAAYFRLNRNDATERAKEIQQVIRNNWKKIAKQHGIPEHKITLMREAFSQSENTFIIT